MLKKPDNAGRPSSTEPLGLRSLRAGSFASIGFSYKPCITHNKEFIIIPIVNKVLKVMQDLM